MRTLDEVPDGDDLPVSATLFVTYRRCPQQALARVRGVYPKPSRASFKGALTHRLIARHLEDGPIPGDRIDLVCRQETGENLNAQLAASGIHRPSEFRAIVAEVRELYQRFATLPPDPVAATELAFEVPVGNGITLRGRIDAVFDDDDGQRIVDWKTGPHLGDDVEAQLGFYALAWVRERGVLPARTDAISVATGERREAVPDPGSIASTEHEVVEMVERLRVAIADGTDLDRTAGPHCRWCPILATCTEGSSALALLD